MLDGYAQFAVGGGAENRIRAPYRFTLQLRLQLQVLALLEAVGRGQVRWHLKGDRDSVGALAADIGDF
ncbi:hypothetical protein D3C75_1344280 [compost metagenome]